MDWIIYWVDSCHNIGNIDPINNRIDTHTQSSNTITIEIQYSIDLLLIDLYCINKQNNNDFNYASSIPGCLIFIIPPFSWSYYIWGIVDFDYFRLVLFAFLLWNRQHIDCWFDSISIQLNTGEAIVLCILAIAFGFISFCTNQFYLFPEFYSSLGFIFVIWCGFIGIDMFYLYISYSELQQSTTSSSKINNIY